MNPLIIQVIDLRREYALGAERVPALRGVSIEIRRNVRNREIGFVFQTFNLLPRATALQNVELPLVYAGVGGRARQERARHALEPVGLDDPMAHRPNELSGGQRQRAVTLKDGRISGDVLQERVPAA